MKSFKLKRKSIKRNFKKRTYKRRSLRTKASVPRTFLPFPPVIRRKLVYSTQIALTQATAGIPVHHIFRATSLFDPDYTGVGSQPRYYDTICGANNTTAIYSKYRVLRASISCKVFPTTSSATDGNSIVSIIPVIDYLFQPSSLKEMVERPNCRYVSMTGLGSWKPYTVKSHMVPHKFLGYKDAKDADNLIGPYNNNPTSNGYFIISLCAVPFLGIATSTIMVKIVYDAEFWDLNDVADS